MVFSLGLPFLLFFSFFAVRFLSTPVFFGLNLPPLLCFGADSICFWFKLLMFPLRVRVCLDLRTNDNRIKTTISLQRFIFSKVTGEMTDEKELFDSGLALGTQAGHPAHQLGKLFARDRALPLFVDLDLDRRSDCTYNGTSRNRTVRFLLSELSPRRGSGF